MAAAAAANGISSSLVCLQSGRPTVQQLAAHDAHEGLLAYSRSTDQSCKCQRDERMHAVANGLQLRGGYVGKVDNHRCFSPASQAVQASKQRLHSISCASYASRCQLAVPLANLWFQSVPNRALRVVSHRPCEVIAATSASAASAPISTADVDARLGAFWKWLAEDGAVNPDKAPAKPARVSEGLGLVAQRDISDNDDVFSIPESICINRLAVRSSSIGPYTENLKAWMAVALYLLKERADPSSKWRAYLAILPETLDLPLFWSEEELAEIQGTQLLGSVESYREYLEAEFSQLKAEVLDPNPSVFPPEVFSKEAFFWAFGILRSRTFPPLTGEDIALVPLADLLNHGVQGAVPERSAWERRSAGLFDRQQVVAMKAGRRYSAGEQVFMEYGRDKSISQLALDFGFTEWEGVGNAGSASNLGSQSRESFMLTLEISEKDRFFDDKADVAEINGLETTTYFDLVRGEGPPDTMLTYLRLIALGGSDSFLLEALFRSAVWGHLSLPVSKENEEAVCQAMLEGCQTALQGFSTSIEQDLRLLKEGGLSRRKETAVVARLGEKRVLTELLDWFEARLQALEKLEYYQERRLRDLGLLDDEGSMTPWVFNE